jgi:hypothetical protein
VGLRALRSRRVPRQAPRSVGRRVRDPLKLVSSA